MCCLFGLVNYSHSLSAKQKNHLTAALASAAEERGTDAAGIAYNSRNRLRVYKRPWPAHFMTFRIPQDSSVIMGHTRLTTQGDASKNYNNHPFLGHTLGLSFALAHNGVVYNDEALRHSWKLPRTKIETDSYVAVQLIEKENALDFNSLKHMAEQVEGSFSFSVLDSKDNLYIVKGDNPLCLFHFPTLGLYVYASTERILKTALCSFGLSKRMCENAPLRCGDIICIDTSGKMFRSRFDNSSFYPCLSAWNAPFYSDRLFKTHLDIIKSVSPLFGYTPEAIDALADRGFSAEEIEDWLYNGNLR